MSQALPRRSNLVTGRSCGRAYEAAVFGLVAVARRRAHDVQHVLGIGLPSRWPCAARRRPSACAAPVRRIPGWTIRRLWWRFLCQGSGRTAAADRAGVGHAVTQHFSASQLYTRTLPRPWVSRPLSSAPTPGLCTSTPMKSMSGAAAAISGWNGPCRNRSRKSAAPGDRRSRRSPEPHRSVPGRTSASQGRGHAAGLRSCARRASRALHGAHRPCFVVFRQEPWAGDCGVSLMERKPC